MSTRTIIEINHDELDMLQNERECVFPQLLHALRSGEGPRWVGRSFISGDGIRILGQRHHSEPIWPTAAPLVARMRAALAAMYLESNGHRKDRLQMWAEAMRETSDLLDYFDEQDPHSTGDDDPARTAADVCQRARAGDPHSPERAWREGQKP